MKTMEPIIHDLKAGNLRRVAKSTFAPKNRSKGEVFHTENSENESRSSDYDDSESIGPNSKQ